jgi:catechol 2,3-dioxygenase-like lactoylglutathione lyase family enzyme
MRRHCDRSSTGSSTAPFSAPRRRRWKSPPPPYRLYAQEAPPERGDEMEEMMAEQVVETRKEPVLKLKFLSHGTLESSDIEKSKRFYQEFLGLEVVQTSKISLMIRLGNTNTIAVVYSPRHKAMTMLNHNGLDVATREEVDQAYEIVMAEKDKWGITKVTKPVDQHGTRSFYLVDQDENWWDILSNPEGGYSWMFNKGRDIAEWGAGEEKGFNPNDYSRRMPNKANTPTA